MSHGDTGAPVAAGDLQPGDRPTTPAIMEVLHRISGKWSIGILLATMRGPARFTQLEREVKGISRRMLTLTLRNLERDGLVVRTVYPTVPPKVEYTATTMARELHDTLVTLTRWAHQHQEEIAQARAVYDRNAERDSDAIRQLAAGG